MHVDELRPEREEHLLLTMLPLDVLHTILLQRGIGARELCALESTCLMFRQLVDEAAWQHAFVQRRRVNVLRAPQGWKQELSRRELWSRDWRQLVGCSNMFTFVNLMSIYEGTFVRSAPPLAKPAFGGLLRDSIAGTK